MYQMNRSQITDVPAHLRQAIPLTSIHEIDNAIYYVDIAKLMVLYNQEYIPTLTLRSALIGRQANMIDPPATVDDITMFCDSIGTESHANLVMEGIVLEPLTKTEVVHCKGVAHYLVSSSYLWEYRDDTLVRYVSDMKTRWEIQYKRKIDNLKKITQELHDDIITKYPDSYNYVYQMVHSFETRGEVVDYIRLTSSEALDDVVIEVWEHKRFAELLGKLQQGGGNICPVSFYIASVRQMAYIYTLPFFRFVELYREFMIPYGKYVCMNTYYLCRCIIGEALGSEATCLYAGLRQKYETKSLKHTIICLETKRILDGGNVNPGISYTVDEVIRTVLPPIIREYYADRPFPDIIPEYLTFENLYDMFAYDSTCKDTAWTVYTDIKPVYVKKVTVD